MRFVWLRQAFGFRTDTNPAAVPEVAPTSVEIETAADTLMRAWAPFIPMPGESAYTGQDYDDYDYGDNGCGCGGEDEDGDPVCNCVDGCSCTSCEAWDWRRHKYCSAGNVSIGTHCGLAARYRVVTYRLVQTFVSDTSEGAVCPHGEGEQCRCTLKSVFLDAGLMPSVSQHRSACSVAHAQQIIAQMQQAYPEPDDKPSRLRYRIEAWTYKPHCTELPEHLVALRDSIRSAWDLVDLAISDPGNADRWLEWGRRSLARAAWRAARPVPEDLADEEPYDDASFGSPQEEPPDPWATPGSAWSTRWGTDA